MCHLNLSFIFKLRLQLHCKFLILILRKKNTQNEHIIAHFEYFFICHYIKTIWLAETLNEIKITHYEKIFSYIKQEFSHFEKGLVINDIFVVSLRLPLFSPRYITLKRNQKIVSKISNYLTYNTFLMHPGNLPLKETAFNEFKLTHHKTNQISEPSFFKDSHFKILKTAAQI